MKYLFVPYEIAIVAKSQGFNEPCLAYYERQQLSNIVEYSNSKLRQENLINGQCLAPIYQQLIDWFRDKHNLHIEVFHQLRPANNVVYGIKIGSNTGGIQDGFNNYYEALNKALEEAFKLINIEEVK